jgi:hypothetical protein
MQPNSMIKLHENKDIGIVSLISMQFRTNILAMITRSEIFKEDELHSPSSFINSNPGSSQIGKLKKQFEFEKFIHGYSGSHMSNQIVSYEEATKRKMADKMK